METGMPGKLQQQHAGYISTGIVEGINPQFESSRSSELKPLKKPMCLLSTMRFLHKNHPLVKYFLLLGFFPKHHGQVKDQSL